jgi:hypothetical protein
MKKKWLLIPILTIVLIFMLLPVSYLNANPGNLIQNGDFSGGFNHWYIGGAASVLNKAAYLSTGVIEQYFIDTSNKNLKLSFGVKPEDYSSIGYINVGFWLYKNGGYIDEANYYYPGLSLNIWHSESFSISKCWKDLRGTNIPDFNQIGIWLEAWNGGKAYFDNVKLEAPGKKAEAVEEGFIRTMPMTCYQVWVNADNKFEFVFWYPYADNNWVKIYDMSGKEVYSVDMPLDDPHIIVDLPNGMYTVKTFNDQPEPLQTFVIGK